MRNTVSEIKLDIRSFYVGNSRNSAPFSLSQLIPTRIDGTEFIFDEKYIYFLVVCAPVRWAYGTSAFWINT